MSQQPVPETCSANGTRSGQLLGFLFGLAPDGVFRASAIALGAVGSYPAFSPLPPAEAGGGLIFCGTFRRKVVTPSARVYLRQSKLRGIAPCGVRTFLPRAVFTARKRFSALPKSGIRYHFKAVKASGGFFRKLRECGALLDQSAATKSMSRG